MLTTAAAGRFAATRLAIALLLAVCIAGAARPGQQGSLRIGQPWTRPTPPGALTAAGYLTITNVGHGADRLLGASSPFADHIEIHRMTMTGGIMRMRPIVGGLAIAAGQTLAIEPSGYHLMMIAPKRPFVIGRTIPAILRFERAGPVPVAFIVRSGPPAGAMPSPRMAMP